MLIPVILRTIIITIRTSSAIVCLRMFIQDFHNKLDKRIILFVASIVSIFVIFPAG